jgi:hypothetical protein
MSLDLRHHSVVPGKPDDAQALSGADPGPIPRDLVEEVRWQMISAQLRLVVMSPYVRRDDI